MVLWNEGWLWDSGELWGPAPGIYPNVAYGLFIDWDGDGVFTFDGSEANYMLSWSSDRGREFFLNSNGDGLEPIKVGKLMITLENSDGRFDPFNSHSPIYPHVLPGRKVQFVVQDSYSLTNHTVFTGEIENIKPFAQEKNVQISVVDATKKLGKIDTTIALNANIKVSDAIEAVLDSVGYTNYEIDSLLDVIPYWWVNKQKAINAIQELCDASFGTFFIAADGKAKYYSRSKAVSSVISLLQNVLLEDMANEQPWEVVRNNIDVIVNPIVKQSTTDLWTLWDKPTVKAGETIELWGSFKFNNESCPATGVIPPVANTDYTMNTSSDGSGTDLTASFTVTPTIFGESVKLRIKNNSASNGVITLTKVRGDALVTPDAVRLNKQDSVSAEAYGDLTFTLQSKWLQNTNLGITLAETIRDLLCNPRKYPTIRIDSRPDIQYSVDLFDRVDAIIEDLGINGAFRIGSIKHRSTSPTCQTVVTTISLEPVVDVAAVYWVFPTLIGVNSFFA